MTQEQMLPLFNNFLNPFSFLKKMLQFFLKQKWAASSIGRATDS